ncbi:hypothetical protein Ancab_027318 [Ancistrocladus abbreviatus]
MIPICIHDCVDIPPIEELHPYPVRIAAEEEKMMGVFRYIPVSGTQAVIGLPQNSSSEKIGSCWDAIKGDEVLEGLLGGSGALEACLLALRFKRPSLLKRTWEGFPRGHKICLNLWVGLASLLPVGFEDSCAISPIDRLECFGLLTDCELALRSRFGDGAPLVCCLPSMATILLLEVFSEGLVSWQEASSCGVINVAAPFSS